MFRGSENHLLGEKEIEMQENGTARVREGARGCSLEGIREWRPRCGEAQVDYLSERLTKLMSDRLWLLMLYGEIDLLSLWITCATSSGASINESVTHLHWTLKFTLKPSGPVRNDNLYLQSEQLK